MLYRMTTERGLLRGAAYVAAALGIFLAGRWGYQWERGDAGGVDLRNGLWALLMFSLALWSGMHWQWIKPLRWFADISYPLYLVHVPLAWISLTVLAARGWGMLAAGITTGLLVVLLRGWSILVIESPARRFGAAITKRKSPPFALSSPSPSSP